MMSRSLSYVGSSRKKWFAMVSIRTRYGYVKKPRSTPIPPHQIMDLDLEKAARWETRRRFRNQNLNECLFKQELFIHEQLEHVRMQTAMKLVMMSQHRRIPIAKILNCRYIFGFPYDFRERVKKYPQYFELVESLGIEYLQLKEWNPALAVTAFEKKLSQIHPESREKIRYPYMESIYSRLKNLPECPLDILSMVPMISPYSENLNFEPFSLDERKYIAYMAHEFLSLTVEKRASKHDLENFTDELRITASAFEILKLQHRCFYLAGTQSDWIVFLKECYEGSRLIDQKDPLITFRDSLSPYSTLQHQSPYQLTSDNKEQRARTETVMLRP